MSAMPQIRCCARVAPTQLVEKIRTKLGRGSPNTINPMLDTWWKTLSARLDSGPAALHRLPNRLRTSPRLSGCKPLKKASAARCSNSATTPASPELDKERPELRSRRPHASRRGTGFCSTGSRSYDQRSHLSAPRALTPAAQGTGDAGELLTTKLAQLPDSRKPQRSARLHQKRRQEKRPRGNPRSAFARSDIGKRRERKVKTGSAQE